jgi:hypothetical protein
MLVEEITSVGWLNNHDGSICIVACLSCCHVYVTVPKNAFHSVGGINGLKTNKQLVVDFYVKYGSGRP